MGTVFLTNLATVAGKYEQYDILSAILDFETHNHLPLKKLWLLKTLKKTLQIFNCTSFLDGSVQLSLMGNHMISSAIWC